VKDESGVALQPIHDLGMLMGGMVVEDDEIAVPRARIGTADGGTAEWKSRTLSRYARTTKDARPPCRRGSSPARCGAPGARSADPAPRSPATHPCAKRADDPLTHPSPLAHALHEVEAATAPGGFLAHEHAERCPRSPQNQSAPTTWFATWSWPTTARLRRF
jgi:hypothetical protein